jgi:hypothetical protein
MPRTKSPAVSQLSVRLTDEERVRLSAVAYDLALTNELAESTSDVNLSDFIRRVLNEFINGYFAEQGGEKRVLKRYHDAKLHEMETEMEELRRSL